MRQDSFEAEVGDNRDRRPCPGAIGVSGLFCPLEGTQLQIRISSPRSVSLGTSGLTGQTSLYKQGGEGEGKVRVTRSGANDALCAAGTPLPLMGPAPWPPLSLTGTFSSTIFRVCFTSLSAQWHCCPCCCFMNSSIGSCVFLVGTVSGPHIRNTVCPLITQWTRSLLTGSPGAGRR